MQIKDLVAASVVTIDDILCIEVPDTSVGAEEGDTITRKVESSVLGQFICNSLQYSSALQTTSKTIVGAINEIAQGGGGGSSYTDVTGTLTAGSTSITLLSADITTTKTFDFYTDKFGVNPTSVTVSSGSIVLTFEAQSSDMSVKVRVW